MNRLSTLEEKGFAVVEGFLNDKEVEDILTAYEDGSLKEGMFPVWTNINNDKIKTFDQKCAKLTKNISDETDISCDVFSGLTFFSVGGETKFWSTGGWHQDVVGSYTSPNVYNYLNIYVPILKPERTKSNLSVIPFDILKKVYPSAAKNLLGRGLSAYHFNDTVCFTDEETDKVVESFRVQELDDISFTPNLSAGDALIVRGDTIHKSQDFETKRTSISYRMRDSRDLVSIDKLLNAGLDKSLFMIKSAGVFAELLNALHQEKTDRLTFGQIYETIKKHGNEENFWKIKDITKLLIDSMDNEKRKRFINTMNKKQKWGVLDAESIKVCDYILARMDSLCA